MAGWWLSVDTAWGATKATTIGMFGAVASAVWIGHPTVVQAMAGHIRAGLVSPIEVGLVALLVIIGLIASWRFYRNQGATIGQILIVIVTVEAAKRILMTINGPTSFYGYDLFVVLVILAALANGVRGARAMRDLPVDD